MRLDLPFGPPLDLPTDPSDPHLWVGALGLGLAFAGSRLYRLAIVGPGIAIGAVAGLEIAAALDFNAQLVAAGCMGVLGGFIFHFVERLAIALSGAFLVGGAANIGGALVLGHAAPWYVGAAGAVLGLLLFPSLFKRLLPLVTAVIGGLCAAWALGQPDDLRVVAVVAVAGLIVQAITRKGADKEKD